MSVNKLIKISDIGESLLSEQLEFNLIKFFQWALLEVGGFFNVTRSLENQFEFDQSKLTLVDDDRFGESGCVWEGFRKEWVWESGLDFETEPLTPVVYVDGEIVADGYNINYPLGRVIFDEPVSEESIVQAEYSYRLWPFLLANTDWWRQFQSKVFDSNLTDNSAGILNIFTDNRIQLPCVLVESIPKTRRYGKQLGSLTHVTQQDVLFHIVGDDAWQVKQMHDIITYQQDKRIIGVDKNLFYENDEDPLDFNGYLKVGAKMYPQLTSSAYTWKTIIFKDMASFEQPRISPIYYCVVRGSFEVDL